MFIIIFLVFIFSFSLTLGLFMAIFSRQKVTDKLKYFDDGYEVYEAIEKKEKKSVLKAFSKLIPNFKFNSGRRKKRELELIRADVPLTYNELLVVKLILVIITSLFVYLLSRDLILVTLFLVVAYKTPDIIISSKKKNRIKEFDAQLTEAIVIISNSLKAGYSFLQAIAVVSEQIKEPLGKEFKRLLKEMSLGLDEKQAFLNLQNRIDSEDLNLLINAILIQKDIGGNLSEILDNISETIRERQKIKNELKTLTAQGKLTGMIISMLPVFLGGVIYIFNKEYIMLLFTTKIGIGMLVFSLVSELMGLFFIKKVISIEI